MRLGLGLGILATAPTLGEPMVSYLFLDGNSLRSRIGRVAKRYANGADLSVNWWGPLGGHKKVFYYDAVPVRLSGETEDDYSTRIRPIVELHAKISSIGGYRVNEGDARFRSGRGQEQKKVDVMIAVDMLTHTIRKNMAEASLLAGDVDFRPLLDAVVREGMFVTLIYPPDATGEELKGAADAGRPLSVQLIYEWLDQPSQQLIGPIPQVSRRNSLDVANAVLIDKCGANNEISLLHELTNDTVKVYVPADDGGYVELANARWTNTQKLAWDDHKIELPERLPNHFHELLA